MQVVLSKGVDEGKILFLSLIAAPEGIHMVCKKFPRVKVITSEIDEGIDESTFQVIPGEQSSLNPLMAWRSASSFCVGLGSLHNRRRAVFTSCRRACPVHLELWASCESLQSWQGYNSLRCLVGVGEFGDRYFCD